METKNGIIIRYITSLMNMVDLMQTNSRMLNNNPDENNATIAILNIDIESIKSQLNLLQNAIDNYNQL